jgi:hypothetical protein
MNLVLCQVPTDIRRKCKYLVAGRPKAQDLSNSVVKSSVPRNKYYFRNQKMKIKMIRTLRKNSKKEV